MCDGTMHNESIYNLIPPAEAVIEKPVMHRSMVRVLDAKELWWCCERERERERGEKVHDSRERDSKRHSPVLLVSFVCLLFVATTNNLYMHALTSTILTFLDAARLQCGSPRCLSLFL